MDNFKNKGLTTGIKHDVPVEEGVGIGDFAQD
jgi:hypothetical protein